MPTVISSRPGAVRLLQDAAVQATIPPLVGLRDPDKLQFGSERALINSVGINEATNHQFMQTLGSDIYIYVFGDRIGQVNLGGLAFAAACDDADRGLTFANNVFSNPFGAISQLKSGGEHGAAKVRRWFNNRKLSSRTEPVSILFGNATEPLTGFVTNWNAKVADVPSNLVSWNITLALIPERVAGGGSSGSSGGSSSSSGSSDDPIYSTAGSTSVGSSGNFIQVFPQ